jgi:acetyltransferase-like isoleucine patch superfamily enzyme
MHQLNTPSAGVLIEPHVWLGQGTQVLKDVTIGACSVVAAGSIVSTDLPRFSVACGVPAKILRQDIKNIWSRGYSKMHVDQAIFYRNKFLPDK